MAYKKKTELSSPQPANRALNASVETGTVKQLVNLPKPIHMELKQLQLNFGKAGKTLTLHDTTMLAVRAGLAILQNNLDAELAPITTT